MPLFVQEEEEAQKGEDVQGADPLEVGPDGEAGPGPAYVLSQPEEGDQDARQPLPRGQRRHVPPFPTSHKWIEEEAGGVIDAASEECQENEGERMGLATRPGDGGGSGPAKAHELADHHSS